MSSKATRRSRKRNRLISLPGGEAVNQPPSGRDRHHTNQPQEDPRLVVTFARIRQTGIMDAKDAIQPLAGTQMGMCIISLVAAHDRASITDTWESLSAAHRNYRMIYIGQTGNPKCAAIAFIPEAMETDQSLRVDIRTAEERVVSAKTAWAAWERKINALQAPQLRWAIRGVLDGFMGDGTLWRDAAPTDTGRTAVMALRVIAQGKSK